MATATQNLYFRNVLRDMAATATASGTLKVTGCRDLEMITGAFYCELSFVAPLLFSS
jgi:hypothetical protein